MDTYADDVAALTETLDLTKAIHVGHSTGGGEVARYIGRHGTKRVAKAVLISAVPPLILKTEANPEGLPISAFDALRAAVRPIAQACHFTAITGRAPRSPRECESRFGCKACWRFPGRVRLHPGVF